MFLTLARRARVAGCGRLPVPTTGCFRVDRRLREFEVVEPPIASSAPRAWRPLT